MSIFNNMKMKPKLIGTYLFIGLIPLLLIAFISLDKASSSLMNEAFDKLESVKNIKTYQVNSFFSERLSHVKILALNPYTIQSLKDLKTSFDKAGDRGYLGKRALEDKQFANIVNSCKNYFAEYIQTYGYNDLFLISPDDGDIIFSSAMENDFGTTLSQEITHLASTWKAAIRTGQPVLSDMKPYAPSKGTPAMFVAAPVTDNNGTTVGVVALQISNKILNDIMQERSGLGKTGETYLVGSDKRMRSDSFLDPSSHSVSASFRGSVEKNGVDTDASRNALSGNSGSEIIDDYDEIPALSAYGPINLPGGLTWAIIAEIERSEVKIPIFALQKNVIIFAIIVTVLIFLFALTIANSISNPMNKLSAVAESIANGDLDQSLDFDQKDEIGNLANSLNEMTIGLKKNQEEMQNNLKQAETVIEEIKRIVPIFSEVGDIEARPNPNIVDGANREVLQLFSNLMDNFVADMLAIVNGISSYADGNFEFEAPVLPGKKVVLTNAMNKIRIALLDLIDEGVVLTKATEEGNLTVRGNISKFEGDFRKIIAGFNGIIENILKPVNEAVEVLKKMAEGNLNVQVKGDYKGDHATMKVSLNTTIDSLNEILSQVNIAIDQVNSGAQQVSDSGQSLSQGATEQASSLEEVTSSMTEVGEQTRTNAENAQTADQLASKTREEADRGNQEMSKMLNAMDAINESSKEISKIIKVIDEIAFQTNLLALNAAVEAARAGVHGKGFAVVADEVRNLAQRSAKAAKETTELIEGSSRRVDIGTNIANDTSEALKNMIVSIAKVNDLVGEIATASNEQALSIDQINEALAQIDQVTQGNTTTAEESASAAEELSSQSSHLQQMIASFQLRDSIRRSTNSYQPELTSSFRSYPTREKDTYKPSNFDREIDPSEIIDLDDDDLGGF